MSVHTTLEVVVCNSPKDAIKQGFFYREPVFKPISIEKAVVVRSGTNEGNPTIDFILVDATGQKYNLMITSKLIATLGAIK